mmetsp:Transcript_33538/g.106371  ORF Transcript_33538/g.106371 Transcript_33538/m.106371 type:complete len:222 (-) Transcript_33538:393-1058(-)
MSHRQRLLDLDPMSLLRKPLALVHHRLLLLPGLPLTPQGLQLVVARTCLCSSLLELQLQLPLPFQQLLQLGIHRRGSRQGRLLARGLLHAPKDAREDRRCWWRRRRGLDKAGLARSPPPSLVRTSWPQAQTSRRAAADTWCAVEKPGLAAPGLSRSRHASRVDGAGGEVRGGGVATAARRGSPQPRRAAGGAVPLQGERQLRRAERGHVASRVSGVAPRRV